MYRVYVTDSLKAIGQLNGQRYIEAVSNLNKPVETRTGDEIILDIKTRINNLGKEG